MFSKLEQVEQRYNELSAKLSDPAVIQDQNRFRELAKEHSSLEDLVRTYQEYKNVAHNIEGNKQLIDESDDNELRQMAKDELKSLETAQAELTNKLKVLLLPKDPNDEKNIILEIRAGTGGDEAALFAADLFRMYSKYAELKKWKVELTDTSETGIGGFKEIFALVSGKNVYSDLKYESGVHRVQRVPKTETSGRVHTSAVTVAVLPEADEIDIAIDESDLKVDVFRSSGPGGQSVNTTDSAVRITHVPSGLVVVCRDERSQHKNKAKAMKILRARLNEKMQAEQDAEMRDVRKSQVGSGDRSEKIRTYNFPQSRVTDHRIGYTAHNLPGLLDGELDDIIEHLRTHFQTEAMKG
jgi:peptide chain release factor 1